MRITNYKGYKIKQFDATKRIPKSILIEEPDGMILLLIANKLKISDSQKTSISKEKLQKMGFSHVYNLYGGIFNWSNRGEKIIDNQNAPTQNFMLLGMLKRLIPIFLLFGVACQPASTNLPTPIFAPDQEAFLLHNVDSYRRQVSHDQFQYPRLLQARGRRQSRVHYTPISQNDSY